MIKQKILCLGDNTSAEAWAHKLTKKFAEENNLTFRGMIINLDQKLEDGCYHIGPVSMQQKDPLRRRKR